jgi:phospholipase C
MAIEPALARLSQVRHIVIVLMENRSFDQMLGYLRRDGLSEVNGLVGDEVNFDADGKPVEVFEWGGGNSARTAITGLPHGSPQSSRRHRRGSCTLAGDIALRRSCSARLLLRASRSL